ncbi:hypothetical protein Q5A_010425 [Serratia inhibens PRI-2C]|nr:hypothetical protein Q5A_010425 [Serratia inhibens PRI-2C]
MPVALSIVIALMLYAIPPLPANLFRLFNLEKCHLHSFWVSFIIGTKTAL